MALNTFKFLDRATATGAGPVHPLDDAAQGRMTIQFVISGGTPTIQIQVSADQENWETVRTVNAAAPSPEVLTDPGFYRCNVTVTGSATMTAIGVRSTFRG